MDHSGRGVDKGASWRDLREARDRAESASRANSEFLARMSHEPGGGQRLILYVEDNVSNLKLMERIIARQPAARLLPAMQGGVGLDLARQHHPDLIVLDLHLPDMSGTEVLKRLKQSRRHAGSPSSSSPQTRPRARRSS